VAAGTPLRPGSGPGWLRRGALAGLLAALGLGLVVAALATTRAGPLLWPERAGGPTGPPAVGPPVQAVLAEADAYYGRDVTLDGRVGRVVTPRAFTLRQGADEILVVAPHAPPPASVRSADRPLAAGDPVAVTGAVRSFDRLFFQRDLGYDLDGALFGDWEDRPAVLALWIDRSP
jgi:hypothetical protein